ncbi:MAG: chromophore lyase [Cyclobacteriaceae bacterium]|nr:chromophore lyase [Cyclobacteriaceae bacterium]
MHADGLNSPPPDGFIPVGTSLVYGKVIDGLTRCAHYHSVLDIIAIRFPCCGRYYPCFECHEECAGHTAQRWPQSRWEEKAILCGACGKEHSIAGYLAAPDHCPACRARFNPRCSLHHHLYFEMTE